MEEHTSQRNGWRKLEICQKRKPSSSLVMRLQDWNLQQSGNSMPQREIKTGWGINLIYPLIRKCSREDCIRRASHWSSWTK
jgi:hypothetical protein